MNQNEHDHQHDDDDLTGIFNDLTPEDFAESANTFGTPVTTDFDQFIQQNIQTVRTSYLAAEGVINPVAILANETMQWSYVPDDNETLGEYAERLGGEARRLGATWLFISRKTLVGTGFDASIDTTDPSAVQRAIEEGLLVQGVFYYASRTSESGEHEHRHGMMRELPGFRLGEVVEGNPLQTTALFANILG